jgi:branched-chain amino acid transport system substrate-binding protein
MRGLGGFSKRFSRAMLASAAAASLVAMAGSASTAEAKSRTPVTIGISLSLSGDFSGDGIAIRQGYELWAADVNRSGGLLGHPVRLVILNDDSSTQQVLTNYQTLIGTDHVNLVMGPFSSLLTIPAESVAKRYGYLMLGPAGGAPAVFQEHYAGYAFVQPAAVADNLVGLAHMIAALPASERPKTFAWATSNDPFTQPQMYPATTVLEKAGLKLVYHTVFPDETPDLQPEALALVHARPDVVILGTTSVPQVQAFVQAFIQQHFNPKALVATSGPDQGSAFAKAVGAANTEGIMVPGSWTPTEPTYQNAQFVKEYLKKYGGTADAIPSDAPEAYSCGQVLQQLVSIAHSLNNAALIRALHSGHLFRTVQGAMRWNDWGVPEGAGTFVEQWQHGKTVIVWPKSIAQTTVEYPKPNWP